MCVMLAPEVKIFTLLKKNFSNTNQTSLRVFARFHRFPEVFHKELKKKLILLIKKYNQLETKTQFITVLHKTSSTSYSVQKSVVHTEKDNFYMKMK